MLDAIKEHTGHDLSSMNESQIRAVCKELGVEVNETMGKGKLIDEILGENVKVVISSPHLLLITC